MSLRVAPQGLSYPVNWKKIGTDEKMGSTIRMENADDSIRVSTRAQSTNSSSLEEHEVLRLTDRKVEIVSRKGYVISFFKALDVLKLHEISSQLYVKSHPKKQEIAIPFFCFWKNSQGLEIETPIQALFSKTLDELHFKIKEDSQAIDKKRKNQETVPFFQLRLKFDANHIYESEQFHCKSWKTINQAINTKKRVSEAELMSGGALCLVETRNKKRIRKASLCEQEESSDESSTKSQNISSLSTTAAYVKTPAVSNAPTFKINFHSILQSPAATIPIDSWQSSSFQTITDRHETAHPALISGKDPFIFENRGLSSASYGDIIDGL